MKGAPRSTAASRAAQRDAGAVTAELAVLLPSIVALLLVLLMVGNVGLTKLQVAGAARAGARSAALGEDAAASSAAARHVAGDRTVVAVDSDGSWVTVQVSRPVGLSWMSFDVSASATAWVEK